jgi:hypothetical protein
MNGASSSSGIRETTDGLDEASGSLVFPRRSPKGLTSKPLFSWVLPVIDTLLVTNGRAGELPPQPSETAASYAQFCELVPEGKQARTRGAQLWLNRTIWIEP